MPGVEATLAYPTRLAGRPSRSVEHMFAPRRFCWYHGTCNTLSRRVRMASKLTRRQQEILTFVRRFTETHGYPPSVREIGQAMGLTSSSTVHSHLEALERKGFVRRDPSKPRALEIMSNGHGPHRAVSLPLVGQVTAGEPILAEQNIEDYLPLPAELVNGAEGFVLRVRGDSMIDAGIQDGDLLIVRRQQTATDGDI